jgi:hypothetical protein
MPSVTHGLLLLFVPVHLVARDSLMVHEPATVHLGSWLKTLNHSHQPT